MKKIRSNKYDLLNYFIYDKKYLSKAYIKHVEKFLESIGKTNSRYRYIKITVMYINNINNNFKTLIKIFKI